LRWQCGIGDAARKTAIVASPYWNWPTFVSNGQNVIN
jgi:hypothetical protein